jgi:hypothetical protein
MAQRYRNVAPSQLPISRCCIWPLTISMPACQTSRRSRCSSIQRSPRPRCRERAVQHRNTAAATPSAGNALKASAGAAPSIVANQDKAASRWPAGRQPAATSAGRMFGVVPGNAADQSILEERVARAPAQPDRQEVRLVATATGRPAMEAPKHAVGACWRGVHSSVSSMCAQIRPLWRHEGRRLVLRRDRAGR